MVGIEGYRNATLLPGTVKEQVVRDAGENKVFYFPVTDAQAVPRRKVVEQARCDTCHFDLDLHGSNRNDVDHCVICHNPTETDAAVRPADQMPAQAINFKHMIHKIHTGEEIDESQKPYIVYGFRSSVHDYSHVRFPGNRAKCETCHIPGTEQLPLQAGLLPTTAPRDLIDPMPPVTSACLSCHTNLSAAAHADINTSAKFGESCVVCHGPNADFSVDRVHAQ
jgi:OmcA/MtrC family decaheme c-type cytochrome